jgi:hypothetical protein
MSNDGGIVSGSAGEGATVTDLLLDIADDSTFRALGNWEDIANGKIGLFATVDEGTSVETLGSDESFFAKLVAVGITENDPSKGGTTVIKY